MATTRKGKGDAVRTTLAASTRSECLSLAVNTTVDPGSFFWPAKQKEVLSLGWLRKKRELQ